MALPFPVTWIVYIVAGITFGILMFLYMEREKLREWLPNKISIVGYGESAKRFIIQLEGKKPLDIQDNIVRYKQYIVKFPFGQTDIGRNVWYRSVTFFPVNLNNYLDNHWAKEVLKKKAEVLYYILDDKCNTDPLFLNPQYEAFHNFIECIDRWTDKERKSLKVMVFVLDTAKKEVRLSQVVPAYMSYIKHLAKKFERMAIIVLKCDTEDKGQVRSVVCEGLQTLDETDVGFLSSLFIRMGAKL